MEITWTWWVAFLFLMNQAFWMTQERRYPGSLRESQRRSAVENADKAREGLKELKRDIAKTKRDIKKSQGKASFGQRLNQQLDLKTAMWMYKMMRWAAELNFRIEEKYG